MTEIFMIYFLIFSSVSARSLDAESLNAFASWYIVINEGCLWPHSINEMKLRSSLLISASFSWEILFDFLRSLITSPNASSIVKFASCWKKPNRIEHDNLLTIGNNGYIK